MELEKEKAAAHAGRSSEDPVFEDSSGTDDDKSVTHDGEVSVAETGPETCRSLSTNVMIDDDPASTKADVKSVTCNGEASEEEIGRENCGTFSTNVLVDDDPVSKQGGCADCLIDKADSVEEVLIVETPREKEDIREEHIPMGKDSSKSNAHAREIARKASAIKRTADKIASPVARASQASTPRDSRPVSVGLAKSAPRISKKKANETPLPEIKNFRVGESKSMIMGDKLITKRELKTSQERCKGSLSGGKCSSLKQVTDRALEQFPKNLKAKSVTRVVEDSQRSAKSKEEKESEVKKLRQNLNFKATPMPSFYRTRGNGHSHPLKEGVVDKKIHPYPASNRCKKAVFVEG
ncbi:hypothetical protein F511_29286 [Dorcoceras hygrometricum]|uniref:TPX2 C-terminal domain-containing protein n=1 Tax=Dorcoceras hygrometricum TaxID=472368 RepID=A0A2Z7CUA9_9LAMI|nr:hypothetical protein F511_29286 [Dorcoceras hygrometricum]